MSTVTTRQASGSAAHVPTLTVAQSYLQEGAARNPGPWVAHSRHVGDAARAIAEMHSCLDPDTAQVFGMLHDIGRREGVTGMRHMLDGYRFLAALGYGDAGRACLTHSFPVKDVRSVFGEWDCHAEELAFIEQYLDHVTFDEYDRLIQLCDSLAMASGFVLMEKRMVDVLLRYGPNEFTVQKWRAIFDIKEAFEAEIGRSIYDLLPGVIENTFGHNPASRA